MNEITMSLQADRLLLQALEEDISSEDVTTNAVMPEAAAGQVELICKQEGIIAGLSVFRRVFELDVYKRQREPLSYRYPVPRISSDPTGQKNHWRIRRARFLLHRRKVPHSGFRHR